MRASAAVVAAIVAGSGGVACSDPGPRVVAIGDSITNQIEDDLDDALGDARLRVGATNGATAGEMVARARELASTDVEQLFVNLGTNDVVDGVDPATTLTAVEQVVDAYPSAECVHLVTVNEGIVSFGSEGLAPRIRRVNEGLRRLAERDDRIRLIDWSTIVTRYLDAGQPHGDLTVETIHPTDYGQRVLAGAYERAAEACPDGREPDWTAPIDAG